MYLKVAKKINLILSVLTVIITIMIVIIKGRKVWEVMDMFIAWMIVMFPYVYSYPQAHRVVHIKYVQFFYI